MALVSAEGRVALPRLADSSKACSNSHTVNVVYMLASQHTARCKVMLHVLARLDAQPGRMNGRAALDLREPECCWMGTSPNITSHRYFPPTQSQDPAPGRGGQGTAGGPDRCRVERVLSHVARHQLPSRKWDWIFRKSY